jgi:lipopolysaccharide assembly outer membrane protein LptD (OstA)
MKRCLHVAALFAALASASAQFGDFGSSPVEITADGNTRFEGGVAIAEDNVQIHYGEYSIFADYAEYNPDTRDVLLLGNIRLYTPSEVLTSQRALFNLETKQMRSLEIAGARPPLFFRAFSFQAPSPREFRISDGVATTDDSSMPDFRVRSRSIRVYTDSRVVFVNSTLFVGETPVFWFPYLWANINNSGFEFLPGYDSRWGAFLLSAYSFPLGEGDAVVAKARLDVRSEFGLALGGELKFKYGKNDRSYGDFLGYYAFDDHTTTLTAPGEPSEDVETDGRYRVTFKHRLFLTDDIYATADVNLLSDVDFLEDYFPNEFRIDPQPDTYVSVTKWDEFYTLTLLGRFQINDFQDVTERLPELAFDFKQHQLFGLPVNFDGETSIAGLRRAFSDESAFGEQGLSDYDAFRFDSFNQVSLPTQLFGWLNITPRAGLRLTYYSESGSFFTNEQNPVQELDPDTGEVVTVFNPVRTEPSPLNAPTSDFESGGSVFRPVVNLGVEVSTKLSRSYERIQSRWLGLDGLRHVMQPYMNFSYVYNLGPGPEDILQFDRVQQTTQLLPLDFPQFTAIDSIDTWAIMRFGLRNRLQTRRDGRTYQWLTLDTFFDANFDNPYSDTDASNLFNVARFRPVEWFFIDVSSQIPLDAQGFTELGTRFYWMPNPALSMSVGNRYIDGNDFFSDNSQVDFSFYWRINSNWAVSLYEQYEFVSGVWQYQRYMVHRDLSSWVASFGAQIRDNEGGDTDIGVLFALTLKDAPQVTLPIQFDMGTAPIEPGASN